MKPTIISRNDINQNILNTLTYINEIVAKTMGPGGANVLLSTEHGSKITKDGISVLLSIVPENPFEKAILNIVKDACLKTNKTVGDGTTGTAVLLSEIYTKALQYIGYSCSDKIKFRNGLLLAAQHIEKLLTNYAKPIKSLSSKDGLKNLKYIAQISTNNDDELSDIITKIFKQNGKSANIKLDFSNTTTTEYSFVDGFQIDKGYLSQYFADDTGQLSLDNPNIFISEKPVTNLSEITPIVNYHMQTSGAFIIIAPKFDVSVLNALVMYKMRGLKVCCILVNEFGVNIYDILEDLSILTGAKLISDQTQISFRLTEYTSNPVKEPVHISGSAKTVNIDENKTIIIDGCGDPTTIYKRINSIKIKLENEKDAAERELLQKRISNLEGGIAIISIGGQTSARARERFDLAEDAINACKAALESGILPGCGSALVQLKKHVLPFLESVKSQYGDSSAEFYGADVLFKSIDSIANTVIKNALGDLTTYKLINKLTDCVDFSFVSFDLASEKIDNAFDIGVIDPAAVVINEVLNAAEGAGTLISLNAVITNSVEKSDNIAELLAKSI